MTVFKILDNKDATTDELAKAFSEIESMKTGLEAEKQTAYKKMVRNQQRAMSGNKTAATDLKKSKEAFQDVELKIAACNQAQHDIRLRIIERLPGELQTRTKTLEKEADKKIKAKGELTKRFLALCAEAAIVQEQIEGQPYIALNKETKVCAPGLEFNQDALPHEDHLFFLEKALEYRESLKADGGINSAITDIGGALHKIGKILEKGDFGTEAQKLIDKFLPQKPVEKIATEPERPKSTSHIVDYGKIQKRAYGY